MDDKEIVLKINKVMKEMNDLLTLAVENDIEVDINTGHYPRYACSKKPEQLYLLIRCKKLIKVEDE